MHLRTLGLLAGLVVMSALASPVSAQVVAGPWRVATDSEAVHVVVVGALRQMSWSIVTAVFDSKRRPWRITIPDSSSGAWSTVRRGLFEVLRGRPITAADSVAEYVTFEAIQVKGDSLFSSFMLGSSQRCGPRWTQGGGEYSMVAVRRNGHWQEPTLNPVMISVDDWCLVRKP